jgi:uncharacterized membrane protein YbhN (UPF0104 family)
MRKRRQAPCRQARQTAAELCRGRPGIQSFIVSKGSASGQEDKAGMPPGPKKKRIALAAALFLGLLILAFLVSLSDIRKLTAIARDLDPHWILLGAGSAVASFVAFGLAFLSLMKRFVLRSQIPDIIKIGYVSFTFSEVFVSAGLSGYAVRSVHLAAYGISYLETLIYSLTRACIHYFVIFLVFLLTVGLFLSAIPEGIGRNVVLFQFCLFATLLAYAVRIFLSPAARSRWVRVAGFAMNCAARLRGRAQSFGSDTRKGVENVLDRAVGAMFANGWRTLWTLLWELAGMGLRFAALYAGFRACGYAVDPPVMVAGFIIGTFWAVFVQLPGQLGVMEGAVSATYTAFGIPFEVALGACVLYRLMYSLIPFLLGFLFLPRPAAQTLSAFLKGEQVMPRIFPTQQDGSQRPAQGRGTG